MFMWILQVLVANSLSLIQRTFDALFHKTYNIIVFTFPTTSTIGWAVRVSEVKLGQTFTLTFQKKLWRIYSVNGTGFSSVLLVFCYSSFPPHSTLNYPTLRYPFVLINENIITSNFRFRASNSTLFVTIRESCIWQCTGSIQAVFFFLQNKMKHLIWRSYLPFCLWPGVSTRTIWSTKFGMACY
jgi:hypothetical protein